MGKHQGYVCILDDDGPLVLRGSCPNIQQHAPQPEGYIAWHSWADRMSKTHTQHVCLTCGRLEIWTPKKKRKKR
jgi:hypothetical protein